MDTFAAEAIRSLYFVCSMTEPSTAQRLYWASQVLRLSALIEKHEVLINAGKTMHACNEIYPGLLDGAAPAAGDEDEVWLLHLCGLYVVVYWWIITVRIRGHCSLPNHHKKHRIKD